MSTLEEEYAIPAELSEYIDSGFLLPLPPRPEEKTAKFDIPSLQYDDERGNEYFFTLTWIHPDHNKEFCHFYDETPGDLPNFFIEKETRNAASDMVEDLESLDDLIAWLEGKRLGQ